MYPLRSINSATKYPSIPTYHALGPKGVLLEAHMHLDQTVIATEKIDGTNSRIVLLPDGTCLIGSREEWLHALGDKVFNPALGIVDALREVAIRVQSLQATLGGAATHAFYFETYGGKITAASKQYTSAGQVGVRLFDALSLESLPTTDPASLARWRDAGGQAFANEQRLATLADKLEVQLTPRVEAPPPPSGIVETYEWLKQHMPVSLVTFDSAVSGAPEGLVVRSPDRSHIVKVRFEDYRRHMRRAQRAPA